MGEGEGCHPGSWGCLPCGVFELVFHQRGGEHMEASYLLKQQ